MKWKDLKTTAINDNLVKERGGGGMRGRGEGDLKR